MDQVLQDELSQGQEEAPSPGPSTQNCEAGVGRRGQEALNPEKARGSARGENHANVRVAPRFPGPFQPNVIAFQRTAYLFVHTQMYL